MNKLINILSRLPQWYGIAIIVIYSVLLIEFLSEIYSILPSVSLGLFFDYMVNTSYVIVFLSGIITWIVTIFVFHITAVLFGGHSMFKEMLLISSYFYIIQIIAVVISIFILENLAVTNLIELIDDPVYRLAQTVIDSSFVLYYLLIVLLINKIYRINLLYAVLSVFLPLGMIWGVSKHFDLI